MSAAHVIDEYTVQHILAIHTRNKINWSELSDFFFWSFQPVECILYVHQGGGHLAETKPIDRLPLVFNERKPGLLPEHIGTTNLFPGVKRSGAVFSHQVLVQKPLLQHPRWACSSILFCFPLLNACWWLGAGRLIDISKLTLCVDFMGRCQHS